MEDWRTSCEDCDAELDAYAAMYHWSGPYCEECIEADPEKEGHKWEPKSDFWF